MSDEALSQIYLGLFRRLNPEQVIKLLELIEQGKRVARHARTEVEILEKIRDFSSRFSYDPRLFTSEQAIGLGFLFTSDMAIYLRHLEDRQDCCVSDAYAWYRVAYDMGNPSALREYFLRSGRIEDGLSCCGEMFATTEELSQAGQLLLKWARLDGPHDDRRNPRVIVRHRPVHPLWQALVAFRRAGDRGGLAQLLFVAKAWGDKGIVAQVRADLGYIPGRKELTESCLQMLRAHGYTPEAARMMREYDLLELEEEILDAYIQRRASAGLKVAQAMAQEFKLTLRPKDYLAMLDQAAEGLSEILSAYQALVPDPEEQKLALFCMRERCLKWGKYADAYDWGRAAGRPVTVSEMQKIYADLCWESSLFADCRTRAERTKSAGAFLARLILEHHKPTPPSVKSLGSAA